MHFLTFCGVDIVDGDVVCFLQVLLALDKIWHIEHFVCAHCKRQLGTDIFYENDGLPYCELDFQELFLPKCAECHGAIMEVRVHYFLLHAVHAGKQFSKQP